MGDVCEIEIEVLADTEDAVLLSDGLFEAWIPRSMILGSDASLRRGVHTRVEMSQSYAEEKGLV